MVFNGIMPVKKAVSAPFGLFSVSDVTRHGSGDEHWGGGFDSESEACAFDASIVDPCGGPDVAVVLAVGDRMLKVFPFGIKAVDECLSVGYQVQDRRARVTRQLEMITEKSVERELWNGTYSIQAANDAQYLSSSDAQVVVTSGTVAPSVGIAMLEQALANCGAGFQGVIHAPRSVVTMLGSVLDPNSSVAGGQLQTRNGNLVAAGTGYDGRGPGVVIPNANPMTPWVYATGPVYVHLGPSELMTPGNREATNISNNVMKFVALRPASVQWDGCCHFAVQLDLRKAPATGDTADATVVNGGASVSTTPAPNIVSIAPTGGAAAGGTATVITGTDLLASTGVTFGVTAGTAFSVVNDTTIHVTSPAHAAGAVNVVVTGPGGTDTLTNGYTYV